MRLPPPLRVGAVFLVILSWIAISNHCALAAWSAEPARDTCPMHGKPAKPDSGLVCCKILRAQTASVTVKAPAPQGQLLPVGPRQVEIALCDSQRVQPDMVTLDTGPPGRSSFAELVLQRSLLVHAPPSLG